MEAINRAYLLVDGYRSRQRKYMERRDTKRDKQHQQLWSPACVTQRLINCNWWRYSAMKDRIASDPTRLYSET